MKISDTCDFVIAICLALLFGVSGLKGDKNQTCSCENDGGCVPNQVCDPDNNCDKENVAYGKRAWMSTRHGSGAGETGKACVAVNGRTGHEMKFVLDNGTNCVHSAPDDENASWGVDLGQDYTITDIIIYNRPTQIKRLAGIWISVDNNICKKLPSSTNNHDLISTITCDTPVRGQIVTMSKNGSTTEDTHIINFCEIQIWVCKAGLYGRECNRTCHCANNDTCDNHNGTCPNGCPDTYIGATCSEKCGHCLNGDACDDKTGHCPSGCYQGYLPPLCKIGCFNRLYGQNCSKACGFCKNNAPCDTKTGECKNGCAAPYDGPLCTSDSRWSSIGGISVGCFALGVAIGVIVIVTVGICRHRRATQGVGAESSSSATTDPPATNDAEEAQAKVAKPYNVHVPQSERSLYEGLQYRANDESLYDAPVFAKGGKKGKN